MSMSSFISDPESTSEKIIQSVMEIMDISFSVHFCAVVCGKNINSIDLKR